MKQWADGILLLDIRVKGTKRNALPHLSDLYLQKTI